MKPYRKLKLFLHHLYVAQCSCCATHIVIGARGHGHFVTPVPLAPGNAFSRTLWMLWGWDISSKLLWEFLVCLKQGIFPSLFERGSFQNLVMYLSGYIIN